ncbi:MAG: hypothetical protein P8188_14870 [Gemmatimonadota bacterium]|jgi:hypothetical protein
MPSEFPRSAKNLKGALVVFESSRPIPTNLIVFQYNPDSMQRSFRPSRRTTSDEEAPAGGGGGREVLPPNERFSLEVELDAADQLEVPGQNVLATQVGLHPTLAALELLLYPPSSALILNRALSSAGSSIISQARSPLVLLVWGSMRVVPVRLTSLRVHEQAFDPRLNPLRAEVSLELRALTDAELEDEGPPFETLGIVNQIAKEVLARSHVAGSVVEITSQLPF